LTGTACPAGLRGKRSDPIPRRGKEKKKKRKKEKKKKRKAS
jgi:hypothetical protein